MFAPLLSLSMWLKSFGSSFLQQILVLDTLLILMFLILKKILCYYLLQLSMAPLGVRLLSGKDILVSTK